jgi:glycosyltransferase involved in cell wall biosynthesis
MSTAPPVSVYMPAYNVGPFVRDAVKSILAQTLSDFELIIIDDGSKDETLWILKELEAQDKRIRLISRPNVGVSATANEAIGLARGEFLARMDGDDIATPDRLEKQIAYMRANPACVALGARVLMMDQEGMPLYVMPDVVFGHEKIDAALLDGGWPIIQGVCMFRKGAVVSAGGYRKHLSLHEDHDLFTRLAEIGKLENLPDVLLHYRRHFSSITFRETASSRKVVAGVLREARERRGAAAATELPAPSAPGATEMDLVTRCRHWAWMSLKAHFVPTARKYAWAGFRAAPLSADSWKLMYCALRGR